MRQDRLPRRLHAAARTANAVERLARSTRAVDVSRRGTIDTPVSFSCASISDGTYLSPKPSAFAVTRLWCTASPTIDGSIIDSVKCV